MKRRRIFERDGYRCVYCGSRFPAEELTIDHVQPRVRGGDRSDGNLVTACEACNTLKGDRRLSDFLREQEVARENFFRHAVHVWPRILRTLREELARAPVARSDGNASRG
ncbi:MAG TPA: HNH endonuclease signature motif containing protein [Gemmatimonadaceae bacterium]|nr:HNH endonuclease signature motif containing protein [Gemmatimonadaceae bacterium]